MNFKNWKAVLNGEQTQWEYPLYVVLMFDCKIGFTYPVMPGDLGSRKAAIYRWNGEDWESPYEVIDSNGQSLVDRAKEFWGNQWAKLLLQPVSGDKSDWRVYHVLLKEIQIDEENRMKIFHFELVNQDLTWLDI